MVHPSLEVVLLGGLTSAMLFFFSKSNHQSMKNFRETLMSKEGATLQEMTIGFVTEIKNIADYGAIVFELTNDYKALLEKSPEEEKPFIITRYLQLMFMIHEYGLSKDIF